MSRIKVYDTYTEIINGLFIDIPDEEFTFLPDDLITQLRPRIIGADTNNPSNREISLFTNEERMRQFNIAMQEEMHRQIVNMSEQELIQYFDRISQEEEN